jgi:succinoglycan biosynthesis transport protein ExoP
MLQRVKQAVVNVGGNILGVVLNNVDVRHDQHYEYYTNYYNYYYSPKNSADILNGATARETNAAGRPQKSAGVLPGDEY